MSPNATHPSIRICQCGHFEVDHKSSGSSWPHPLRFGVCLYGGCDCKEFREVGADAAHQATG